MYLNTKYIDVFKYFLNTFLIWKGTNVRHKISLIIQYVNNITDMHVIYYITCCW